jgi:hypothetical protein
LRRSRKLDRSKKFGIDRWINVQPFPAGDVQFLEVAERLIEGLPPGIVQLINSATMSLEVFLDQT